MSNMDAKTFVSGIVTGAGAALAAVALYKFYKTSEYEARLSAAPKQIAPPWAASSRPSFVHNSLPWAQGLRPSDPCIALHYDNDHEGEKITPDRWDLEADRVGVFNPYSGKMAPVWTVRKEDPPLPPDFKKEIVQANGVKCVWTNWPGVESVATGVVLYVHGGANTMAHAEDFIAETARLSQMLGQRVLSVDYRLAPEDPLPASTEDVVSAYRWLLTSGYKAKQIAILGLSSGGTSVMLALQLIIEQGLDVPACGVPVSPWHFFDDRDTVKGQQWQAWQMNVGNIASDGKPTGQNNDVHDPKYSFLNGSFKQMPPLYVLVGSQEHKYELILVQKMAEKARAEDVHVEIDVAPYLQHCPLGDLVLAPEDILCAGRVAAFLQRAFSGVYSNPEQVHVRRWFQHDPTCG
jgi:acetyl esterase/lipase